MRLGPRPLVAAALFGALLLAACGGDGGGEYADALAEVSDNDIARMVLPLGAYGPDYGFLEVDPSSSGFQDNAAQAEDSIDPDDTAADLDEAGRVSGYQLTYVDNTLAALTGETGIVYASTSIELFTDDDAASAMLDKRVEDLRRFEGQEVQPGFSIDSFDVIDVADIGDEAVGLRVGVTIGDAQFTQTLVGFRYGRLLAAANIARGDDLDYTPVATEIARRLETRIEGVLSGDITASPVPFATEEMDDDEAVTPPEGTPDLAAMTLALEDLPLGVGIESEGYELDEDVVASYSRAFAIESFSIGLSTPASLESSVDLHESAEEASLIIVGINALLETEAGPQIFGEAFAAGAGFDAENLEITTAPVEGVGDESGAFFASFDTPVGAFDSAFVYVRVDRVLGTVVATGPRSSLNIDDLTALAAIMAERIRAVLDESPVA